MNLILTCSTIPEFSSEALSLWNRFCLAEWVRGEELVPYLKFSPAAASALIDAIVFLEPNFSADMARGPNGRLFELPMLLEAHYGNTAISTEIHNLPESCAMRDGRKWKKIPHIVLTTTGYRHAGYEGLHVEFVPDVTEQMLFGNYANPVTWNKIEKIVNQYQQRALNDYERIGFMVVIDHGLYRVKRAYHKRNQLESGYYYGKTDKSRFRGFVTVGREQDGVDHEAKLLEHLLNNNAGERELHHFFEEHPDLLAETMMGIPISHQPYFTTNKQTPDFSVASILPRDVGEVVKLLELKGPEAPVLANSRYLHRGLAPALVQALAQINDYHESIHDPLNLSTVEKALGYLPEFSERAVLIGRTPEPPDASLWEKRKSEQASIRIITYDEILQEQRSRHSRYKLSPY